MLERIFDSSTMQLLNRSMDASSMRHQILADNIANVDTPSFKRREVIFEDKLRQAMERKTDYTRLRTTNSRHIQIGPTRKITNVEPEVIQVKDFSLRNDGNNVDIDIEAAKMTKNALFYDTASQSINNEIRLLRMAITGRG